MSTLRRGGGGRLLFGLVLFLFLSFGIGLYICDVVLFLRLGVVFDLDCAIAQLLASFYAFGFVTYVASRK